MFYSYKCSCGTQDYFKHNMNERPTCKCPTCGLVMYKELCSTFIKKGFGWPSQDILEKRTRTQKSNEMKKKQRDTGLSLYDRTSDGRKIKSEKERKVKLESGKADKKIWV